MRTLFALLAALAAPLCAIPNSSAAEPHKDRCVVLVSVDGLANFYLDDPKADSPRCGAWPARALEPTDWSARSRR